MFAVATAFAVAASAAAGVFAACETRGVEFAARLVHRFARRAQRRFTSLRGAFFEQTVTCVRLVARAPVHMHHGRAVAPYVDDRRTFAGAFVAFAVIRRRHGHFGWF